jgi:anthranilate synthase component 2
MRILLLDNFDSFTYNLADYLHRAGADCEVLRNDLPLATLARQPYDGVLLSPGPGRPEQAGCLMEAVAHYAGRVPLLGVCLGHQAIGLHYGARLGKAPKPMHGKLSTLHARPSPLFEGLPAAFRVVRYHSLLLHEPLPEPLRPIAHTEAGELMALEHRTLPIWGVQFHPEAALSEHGIALLRNWLAAVQTFRP